MKKKTFYTERTIIKKRFNRFFLTIETKTKIMSCSQMNDRNKKKPNVPISNLDNIIISNKMFTNNLHNILYQRKYSKLCLKTYLRNIYKKGRGYFINLCKVVISVWVTVFFLFVCPIITHDPLDRFAVILIWGLMQGFLVLS